jgi:hypothetical protein
MRRSFLLLIGLTACGRPAGGGATCGIAAMAGPLVLLGEFATPGQTMGVPPATLPGKLVARLVAGPALPALAGRDYDRWIIGIDGKTPPRFFPSFGVLVADAAHHPLGLLVYEGNIVRDAPILGQVTVADTTIPLIGIAVDPTRIEDPRCPLFPDSVLR